MQPASQLAIRGAGPADASTVSQVLHDSFVEFKALYTVEGFSATTPNAGQVLVRMTEGPVWLAFKDDLAVGTVAAVLKGNSVYVRGMAVLPGARGSGAGRALLQHVQNWAAGHGCVRLFLTTTPFLAGAIRLYERSGFRRIEDGPHDLFGTPLFYMEKIFPRTHPIETPSSIR